MIIQKRVLFVINPFAGGQDKTGFISSLEDYSLKYYFTCKIYLTTGEADKRKITEMLEEFGPAVVIAVGGDGTCNLVGSLLVSTDRIMGIVPMGSANGLATELKLNMQPDLAMQTIITGTRKKMDVILINNENHCFHLSDFGFNASIIKRFKKDKTRGLIGYAKQFLKELFFFKPSRYTIKTGDQTIRKKAHLVAVANASQYGTGVVINPGGEMFDGFFEVCIVKPYPWWAVLKLAFDFMTGRGKHSQYLRIFRATKVQIINNKLQPFHIDGELFEHVKEIEAVILPGALNIIVNDQ